MHKVFSFKGVNKATDDVVAQEGECLEVVNLRSSPGVCLLRNIPSSYDRILSLYN